MSDLTDKSSDLTGDLRQAVARMIAEGTLQDDPAQAPAIDALDGLLVQFDKPSLGNKKSSLGWLFGKKPAILPDQPRGVYLWGGVGRGKSMLMDMFFERAPVLLKKRVHFHAFMQDVHSRIHAWRQAQNSSKEKSADPIPPLVQKLAKESELLCFDEFAVSDVADAMILARLFTGLFEQGVIVVATSNVPPDALYKDGLNRSFFLPFIELIKTRMEVIELASPTDYRMEVLINGDVYLTGKDSHQRFDNLWAQITKTQVIEPAEIEVAGRTLKFDQACGRLLRTTFAELCAKPLGSGDYLALTDRFNTFFIESIPVMEQKDRNAVKRFINLVDTLYDRGVMLVVQADARPSKLYELDFGTEAFEFQRTVSRLREMQGEEWLALERN